MTAMMMDDRVDVLDRVALESAISRLSEEEREIITLWIWHDMKFDEIGVQIGEKYRGKPLTDSAIHYHKKRILVKMRGWLDGER